MAVDLDELEEIANAHAIAELEWSREDRRTYDLIRRAIDYLERERKLAWTRERPTEPGWYWVRGIDRPEDCGVNRVLSLDGRLWLNGLSFPSGVEYAGPIPLPVEPEEAKP